MSSTSAGEETALFQVASQLMPWHAVVICLMITVHWGDMLKMTTHYLLRQATVHSRFLGPSYSPSLFSGRSYKVMIVKISLIIWGIRVLHYPVGLGGGGFYHSVDFVLEPRRPAKKVTSPPVFFLSSFATLLESFALSVSFTAGFLLLVHCWIHSLLLFLPSHKVWTESEYRYLSFVCSTPIVYFISLYLFPLHSLWIFIYPSLKMIILKKYAWLWVILRIIRL